MDHQGWRPGYIPLISSQDLTGHDMTRKFPPGGTPCLQICSYTVFVHPEKKNKENCFLQQDRWGNWRISLSMKSMQLLLLSREAMELDYEDAGPNINGRSGYLFPPLPPPPPPPPPGFGY
ncbi:hypothetical protein Pfo_019593 [Paulownia fortunei]|nr:hypothetical protein Pfo_019593 [Paulownia fortunei]